MKFESLAPLFVSYIQDAWGSVDDPARLELFAPFEKAATLLGLKPEHVEIGLSYWLAIGQSFALEPHEHGCLLAAALFRAIELHRVDDTLSCERACQIFELGDDCHEPLENLTRRLLEKIDALPITRASSQLDAFRAWSKTHVAKLEQQRLLDLWQAPPELDSLAQVEQADFGLILEVIAIDDAMAKQLPYHTAPSCLLLATSDRLDEPLATLPWFGPMNDDQRHEALLKTLVVAATDPDHLKPARPIIVFLPTQVDVDTFLAVPALEGTACATHDALTAHMARNKPESPRKRRPRTSAPRKARRRVRKKS